MTEPKDKPEVKSCETCMYENNSVTVYTPICNGCKEKGYVNWKAKTDNGQPIDNSCENCYPRQVDIDGVCLLEFKCNKKNNFKFWQSEEVPDYGGEQADRDAELAEMQPIDKPMVKSCESCESCKFELQCRSDLECRSCKSETNIGTVRHNWQPKEPKEPVESITTDDSEIEFITTIGDMRDIRAKSFEEGYSKAKAEIGEMLEKMLKEIDGNEWERFPRLTLEYLQKRISSEETNDNNKMS